MGVESRVTCPYGNTEGIEIDTEVEAVVDQMIHILRGQGREFVLRGGGCHHLRGTHGAHVPECASLVTKGPLELRHLLSEVLDEGSALLAPLWDDLSRGFPLFLGVLGPFSREAVLLQQTTLVSESWRDLPWCPLTDGRDDDRDDRTKTKRVVGCVTHKKGCTSDGQQRGDFI